MVLSQLAAELETLGYPVQALLADCLEAAASGPALLERRIGLLNACLDAWIGQFGRAEQPKPQRGGGWKRVHAARQSTLIKLLRLQAGLQQMESEAGVAR